MSSDRSWFERVSLRNYILLSAAILPVVACILSLMGHVLICKCGYVKLWHGVLYSSENSQHLTDWYTFTHVLHGFLYYVLIWLAARDLPIGLRFLIAVMMAGAWEILENSKWVIERYRAVTISLDYYGDSIINSMSDMVACATGFALANRFSWKVSLAFVLSVELMLAYCVRDNLSINIIMLIHPVKAIKEWQMADGHMQGASIPEAPKTQ